ncbi:uncharacterized protein LOC135698374 [Ochlerotatus camptorhynchus]|uniref:uncharacterized protein LOC135698374 n=1 Tax=Ochlerotatus camptorhynchus TaxID=644619 RepID=UPI0031E32E58
MAGINRSVSLPPLPPRPVSTRIYSSTPPPIPPRRIDYANSDIVRQKSSPGSIVRPNSVRDLVKQFQVFTHSAEEPTSSYSNCTRKAPSTEGFEHIYEEIPIRSSTSGSYSEEADGYWSDSTFDTDSEEETVPSIPHIVQEIKPYVDRNNKPPENASDELRQNEQKYIDNLLHGILNYIPLLYQLNLPEGLSGQRNNLFGNIEEIHELHQDDFLPALQRCHRNVDQIAECIIHFIDTKKFYCYMKYAMNRRKANMIFELHRDFFSSIQHDLNSFLLQPIQRLPRYKLFLDKFLKETMDFGESHYTASRISSIHKAQERLSDLVDLLNAAVSISDIPQCANEFFVSSSSRSISGFNLQNDLPSTLILKPKGNKILSRNNPIDLFSQGEFQRILETEIHDESRYRRYKARFFVFEKLIIYTEIVKDSLQYRGHYFDSEINYWEDSKKLHLFCIHRGTQEIQMRFNKTLADTVKTIRQKAISQFFNEPQLIDFNGSDLMPIHETALHYDLDFNKNIRALISSQIRFVQILRANSVFYLFNHVDDQATQLETFRQVFLKMLHLHNDRIIMDLSLNGLNIEAICTMFLQYVKTDFPPIYCEYLTNSNSAAKNILNRPTSANSSSFLVPTVDDFILLCIERLEEFAHFFGTLTADLSDKSTRNLPIDKSLFHQLAIVQVEVEKFSQSVSDNHKLFCLDDGVIGCGLVVDSERAKVKSDVLEASNCKIFICERAAICVSYSVEKRCSKHIEHLDCIVFFDRFSGRGQPMRLRKSKKSDGKVCFTIGGTKYKVRFQSSLVKDRFYAKYVQQYVLLK